MPEVPAEPWSVPSIGMSWARGMGLGHTHMVTRVGDWPHRETSPGSQPDLWEDRGLEIGQRLSHVCDEATAHTQRLTLSQAPRAGTPSTGRGAMCPEDRAASPVDAPTPSRVPALARKKETCPFVFLNL